MSLIEKIQKKKVKSAVIGLGYVGLPLAVEYASIGIEVVGLDLNEEKVAAINAKQSYIQDIKTDTLAKLVLEGFLTATTNFRVLKDVDTINICVPTPLSKTKEPDISYIVSAAEQIARYLKKGQLIILESTTYPGTTEEVLLPMFEKKGFKVGKDFYLAFSPERVDPGNPNFRTKNIPKVVGGVTSACVNVAQQFYALVMDAVYPVSSTKVAETVKLLENAFRAVNIGLVNELAMMCDRMGIDVWEVIEAASTKPFGFMPFYPGPGLGGHCIPIDPQYLSWKARFFGFETRFIDLASRVNAMMPEYVAGKVANVLNVKGKSLKNAKILILGIAYKKNVSDYRESPALEIVHFLKQKGARVTYNDPHVPVITHEAIKMKSVRISKEVLGKSDCVVIVTDHSYYDYEWIARSSQLVLDTRNAVKFKASNVVKL
ncbi:MAG: nucleotide sugar dehydrogenase [Candidatus Omnitrophota bacterium]